MVKLEPIEVKTVESIMTTGLISMDADSNAFQAAKKMSDKVVSSIIITDSSKIVGILTERDLVKESMQQIYRLVKLLLHLLYRLHLLL